MCAVAISYQVDYPQAVCTARIFALCSKDLVKDLQQYYDYNYNPGIHLFFGSYRSPSGVLPQRGYPCWQILLLACDAAELILEQLWKRIA